VERSGVPPGEVEGTSINLTFTPRRAAIVCIHQILVQAHLDIFNLETCAFSLVYSRLF
jgi:hypothetical protein